MAQTASVTGEKYKKKRPFCILRRWHALAQHATRSVHLEIPKNTAEQTRLWSQWKDTQLSVFFWWSWEQEITGLDSQESTYVPEMRCHKMGMPNTGRVLGKGSCGRTRNTPWPATYSNWAAKVPSWRDHKRSTLSLTFSGIWEKTHSQVREVHRVGVETLAVSKKQRDPTGLQQLLSCIISNSTTKEKEHGASYIFWRLKMGRNIMYKLCCMTTQQALASACKDKPPGTKKVIFKIGVEAYSMTNGQ